MRTCVSDITYICCKDGFLYLTCVIDLFDRKLIGWSISDNLTASGTVIPAIRMTNRNRPFKEGMIFHSDRGIQYACKQTVNLLQYHRVEQSMSGKGNCWDNAVLKVSLNLSKPSWFMVPSLKQKSRCAWMYLNILNPGIIIKEDSQHWVIWLLMNFGNSIILKNS